MTNTTQAEYIIIDAPYIPEHGGFIHSIHTSRKRAIRALQADQCVVQCVNDGYESCLLGVVNVYGDEA